MNIDNFQPLLDWIINHIYLSYFFIFLISLSESLVVIGLIVPGIAIMTVIGTFIGAGYLSLWPTLIAAILGAIVGDGISYWIGHKFHYQLRDWWIFRKYPETILRCEKFFAKHGGKSIVFGRFVGPVRPMIPAIAGMMKMPAKYFYSVNIISAILWAPVYLYPGMLFGNTIANLPPEISRKIITIVVILLTAIWIAFKTLQAAWLYINRRLKRAGTRIWIHAENNSLIFLQKFIRHPLTHKKHQVDSFLFLLFSLTITTVFIILTNAHIVTTSLNPFFKHLALLLYNYVVDHTLLVIDSNCSIIVLVTIFVCYIIYFTLDNKTNYNNKHNHQLSINIPLNRNIYLSLSLLISYFIVTYFISSLVQYPTPYKTTLEHEHIYPFSFPDVSYGLLVLLIGYIGIVKFCNNPKLFAKSNYYFHASWILLTCLLIKLILGFSWFSDLIGAVLISACLLFIFCIVYWQQPLKQIKNKKLNLVSLIFISCIVIANSTIFYLTKDLSNYNLLNISQNVDINKITKTTWLKDQNIFQDTKDPIINTQWLGSKNRLITSLTDNNWYQQPSFSFKSFITLLEVKPDIKNLPLLPNYYQDHHASIVLSKIDKNNKILNLRLWESEYKINKKTLWVGTIQYLKPQQYFNLLTLLQHWPRAEFTDAVDKLKSDIKQNKSIKTKIIFDDNYLIDEKLKILLIY